MDQKARKINVVLLNFQSSFVLSPVYGAFTEDRRVDCTLIAPYFVKFIADYYEPT